MRLSKRIARFIERERICRVATVSERGVPHLVPVCHVLDGDRIYFASGNDATKVLNLRANARLALTFDLYSDDWAHLRGVMVRGTGKLIERGPRFRTARRRLYRKYPQYPEDAALDESDSVIVEVSIGRVFSWGFSS